MTSARGWLNTVAAGGGLLLSGCLDPFPEDPGHSAGDDIAAVQPLPGNTVPAGSGPATATSAATSTTSATTGGIVSAGGGSGDRTDSDGIDETEPAASEPAPDDGLGTGTSSPVAPTTTPPSETLPVSPDSPPEADAGVSVGDTDDGVDDSNAGATDVGDAGPDADADSFSAQVEDE